MMPNQSYAIITASLLILSIFTFQYIKIQKQEAKISDLNTEIAYDKLTIEKLQSSNKEFKKTVANQNEAVSKIAIDLDEARRSLDEWKAKKPEIRYEVIYQKIPTIEVKSNECEDIKIMLDDIRNSGF